MLKVLFCTNVFDATTNGPARFSQLLLRWSLAAGDRNLRILTEDIDKDRDGVFKINLRYPKFLGLFSQFFRMVQYHKQAMKIRHSFQFDVIVYNHAIVALWTAWHFKNTVGMINDDNNSSRRFSLKELHYSAIKQLIFKQVERQAVRRCKLIIVNSRYLLNHLGFVYPGGRGKYRLLYKGIDLRAAGKVRVREGLGNPIRVLFVKNDYLRGGLAVLIQALALLPEFTFVLTVIGPSNVEEPMVRKMAESPNLSLRFLGYQGQDVVFRELVHSDIFCVPSLREALGVANIEALSLGIPVVSSKAGGIPEVLMDGAAGWLSEPGNPKSLAGALNDCITQEQLRREKCVAGLNQASRFSSELMFKNFISILEDVVNREQS